MVPSASKSPEGSQVHNGSDSPHSSVPSTPEDQKPGNRNVKVAGEDYFTSDGRLPAPDTKSAPISPQAMASKSLVFSPRIQFHETWPSGEYDRRGDIATCNRLTPLLAQQIKEELNNFKMVRYANAGPKSGFLLTSPRRWKFMRHQKSTPTSSKLMHFVGVCALVGHILILIDCWCWMVWHFPCLDS